MDNIMNEKLTVLINKFQEAETLHKLGDDEGALKILETISDSEIRILEGLGRTFTKMAEDIKTIKSEKEGE